MVASIVAPMTAYLRRRAPKHVLERESAADLAQSVCREALESLRRGTLRYQGPAELRQWLYGAADLKLRNRVRFHGSLKRAGAAEREIPLGHDAAAGPADAVPDRGPTTSRGAVRRERDALLLAAIGELDERTRIAVTHFYLEGRSHAEVAQLLGVTESHSRTLVARGLARLARRLDGRVEPPVD